MPTTDPPLSGKIALVTGGSRGIGAAICKRLARDGAAVAVNFSHSEGAAKAVVAAIRDGGGEAEAVHADLSTPEGPRNCYAALDAAFGKKYAGRLDILVNNAGIGVGGAIADCTDEQFDRIFAVNVRAVFQLTREAARRMKSGGRIVTIGSILGEATPRANQGLYDATKFAVAGFTRAWSRDLGPKGITVNAVHPGPIDTDLNPADGTGADAQRAITSVGHYGKPDDIAAAVAYLVSAEASFVNGERLAVDGGTSA